MFWYEKLGVLQKKAKALLKKTILKVDFIDKFGLDNSKLFTN